MNEKIIFDFLDNHHIHFTLFKHQPLFTMRDKPILKDCGDITTIPGAYSKNLFLKDDKGSFYLVSVVEEKRVDLKALSNTLECGRFSFGKPEELLELLGVQPGSVTPFGLIFDKKLKVTLILDEDFLTASFINAHPLRNDMTIGVEPHDFLRAMVTLGHKPRIARIPSPL